MLGNDGRTKRGQDLDSESTTTTAHHTHTMTDSNEVDTADEDAIARAMNTQRFKTWSSLPNNTVLKYGTSTFKKVVDDASVTEQKLIERLCLGSESSKKQAMKKKQSREDKKRS